MFERHLSCLVYWRLQRMRDDVHIRSDGRLIWHAPSYYVQLCQPKCQIYEKTKYFEYAPTVLKPNLFYLINFSGINNAILEGKVEDKILNEARQRHITEKLWNFGTWNCGTLQRVFFI